MALGFSFCLPIELKSLDDHHDQHADSCRRSEDDSEGLREPLAILEDLTERDFILTRTPCRRRRLVTGLDPAERDIRRLVHRYCFDNTAPAFIDTLSLHVTRY